MPVINLIVSKTRKDESEPFVLCFKPSDRQETNNTEVSYLIVGLLCDVIQTPAYVLE